jgi:hypothetical protein
MLKTIVLALFVAIVGIAFVSAENEDKIKITTHNVTGKIVAVDSDGNFITIRDSATGTETKYLFKETTTFFRDGKTIKVSTLVPDDEVTLRLSPDEENVIVRLDTPVVVVEKDN